MAAGEHTVATNRRARHEFEILERLEAGLALMGTEVKSLRAGKVVLRDAYATERDGELWLVNATIEPYAQGNRENHEPDARPQAAGASGARSSELASRVAERGLTLVPLRIYFKDGRAKVEIALARGKEGGDKREALAERDVRREIEREMKSPLARPRRRIGGRATAALSARDILRALTGATGFDAVDLDGTGSKPRIPVGLVNHPEQPNLRRPIRISHSLRSPDYVATAPPGLRRRDGLSRRLAPWRSACADRGGLQRRAGPAPLACAVTAGETNAG